jgi:hypothetical protein
MNLEYLGRNYPAVFNSQLVRTYSPGDILLFQCLDVKMPQFPNIIKNFVSDADLVLHTQLQVMMRTKSREIYGPAAYSPNRSYNVCGSISKTLPEAFVAKYVTQSGDCGRVVQVTTGELAGKFLGIHVAGSHDKSINPRALISPITRENLESALDAPEEDFDVDISTDFSGEGPLLEGPNLKEFKLLPSEDQVFLSTRTKIKRSAISRLLPWKSDKQPAVLSHHDTRGDGRIQY